MAFFPGPKRFLARVRCRQSHFTHEFTSIGLKKGTDMEVLGRCQLVERTVGAEELFAASQEGFSAAIARKWCVSMAGAIRL